VAERRMFAKTIIDSDAFLDMPLSTQLLYFHLSMRADDDGFINNPKKVQRIVGCCDDDLKLLIVKNFIIPFESGVVVIKHWKIHNYIQGDRYKATVYQEEKSMLQVKGNKAYTLMDTECIQNGNSLDTQVRLGKDSIELGKDSIDNMSDKPTRKSKANSKPKTFVPPTLEDIKAYCKKRNNNVDAQKFFDYYDEADWYDSKGVKMKSWKQKVITWETNEIPASKVSNKFNNFKQDNTDFNDFEKKAMEKLLDRHKK
jgi:hypothetical protein